MVFCILNLNSFESDTVGMTDEIGVVECVWIASSESMKYVFFALVLYNF